jgi:hypothetical protein
MFELDKEQQQLCHLWNPSTITTKFLGTIYAYDHTVHANSLV